jgi:tetratricopeptide (TPR) repeat protein
LRLAPTDYRLLCNKGLLLIDMGRHRAAIPVLLQAAEQQPGDACTWNNLGLAYYNLMELEDAFRAYGQAIRILFAGSAAELAGRADKPRIGRCEVSSAGAHRVSEAALEPSYSALPRCRS